MRRVLGFLLLTSLATAGDLEGEWSLTMTREARWTPRVCRATLSLKRVNRKWEGWVRWDVLMNGNRIRLAKLNVTKRGFTAEWDIEKWRVSMSAKLDGGALRGTCDWTNVGRWPIEATRGPRKEVPKGVARFEHDLEYTNFFDVAQAEALGLDGAALDRLVVAAQRADTDALVVLKDGKVICERYFFGHRGPIHLMSVTKFVTSLAAARLLQDRKIPSLDAPVSRWFAEFKKGAKAEVTVRQLMEHTSGLVHERMAHTLNKQDDKLAYVLALPVRDPGKESAYSNEGIQLLGGILERAAGKPLDAYVDEVLFKPLQIRDWKWDRDAAGHTLAYANLALRARDLARIAQLCLRHGGKLIDRRTLDTFARPSRADPSRGLVWRLWKDPAGFGHTGWLGQFVVVYPDLGLVGIRLRRARRELDNRDFEFGSFASMLAELQRQ